MDRMSTKHTPGPWEVDAKDMAQTADGIFSVGILAADADGDLQHVAIALLHTTADAPSDDMLEECKANARRIVAAWNACDGISTEALEAGAVADLLEALKDGLAALEAGCRYIEGEGSDEEAKNASAAIDAMRAAIAKANGEQS